MITFRHKLGFLPRKKKLNSKVNLKQEAEAAWKLTTTVLRKTWHMNQIFELVLEQCVANYYRDNTIAK